LKQKWYETFFQEWFCINTSKVTVNSELWNSPSWNERKAWEISKFEFVVEVPEAFDSPDLFS
jgi:hypothetical protein